MFDVNDELTIWDDQLKACGLKNPEFRKELCDHLMADYEKLLPVSPSPRQAFERAVRKIGPVKSLVREYRKTYGLSVSRHTEKSFFRESVGTLTFYFVFNGLAGTFASILAAITVDDLAIRLFCVLGLCFTVPLLYVGTKLELFLAQHSKFVLGLLTYALCLHVLRFPFLFDMSDLKPATVGQFLFALFFVLYLMKNVRRLARDSDIPEPG